MKYTSCIIILSSILLQGCVGALVAGTAAVATKTTTDPRTYGTQVDDSTLELRVEAALADDKILSEYARIIATAYQGKVLLTGQAPTRDQIKKAQDIAFKVDGVNEIYNEIRLGSPVGLSVVSYDTWLTTKIRNQLLFSNKVQSTKIKVITENSEVFLLGIVTPQEGKAAVDAVKDISGVKVITTVFTYITE